MFYSPILSFVNVFCPLCVKEAFESVEIGILRSLQLALGSWQVYLELHC